MVSIQYERYRLQNGLTVLLHHTKNTLLSVVNVLYKVGSRNEHPERTGFAHLFEHLMFSGTHNEPNFDEIVQMAGGENNAFTNTDITNYYINIPSENIDIALWLEADRMQNLNINEQSLNVQRKVVVEEFKQRYLNKPYGDVMLLFRSLLYEQHPYQWATIGKDPSHIEAATIDEVAAFYKKWYNPSNAILAVVGNIDIDQIKKSIEYYFGNIPYSPAFDFQCPEEPEKKNRIFLEVERNVPVSQLVLGFLMTNRLHRDYYVYDMISDLLGNGRSSRLYKSLVIDKKIFKDINAYIAGTLDKGFLIIEGKIYDNYSLEFAEEEVWKIINSLKEGITDYELQKVKNKYEANFASSFVGIQSIAEMLAYYEFIGDVELINNEIYRYTKITQDDIIRIASSELLYNKSVALYYKKKN